VTTMAHTWKPSEAQVKLLKTVFNERVPLDEVNREQHWKNLTQNISNPASFQTALTALKARPRVQAPLPNPPGRAFLLGQADLKPEPVAPVLPELARVKGVYRNPADGTLYRLSVSEPKHKWERPTYAVSVYSNKATVRRLTPEGRMVKKGKWNRLDARHRDALIHYSYAEKKGYRSVGEKILAAWLLTDEQVTEWAVGTCMCCWSPLIDAVSVWNSIGPVCAKKYGVALQTPPSDWTPPQD
jgi:hypothetical protein